MKKKKGFTLIEILAVIIILGIIIVIVSYSIFSTSSKIKDKIFIMNAKKIIEKAKEDLEIKYLTNGETTAYYSNVNSDNILSENSGYNYKIDIKKTSNGIIGYYIIDDNLNISTKGYIPYDKIKIEKEYTETELVFFDKDKFIIKNNSFYKNLSCDERVSKKGYISYEDFYATGDGKTDDANAIYYAHECANKLNLPINTKGNYYIHHMPIIDGKLKYITIKTNVNWNNSKIIIDDKDLSDEEKNTWLFHIPSVSVIYNKTLDINYNSNTKTVPEIIELIKIKKNISNFFHVGITSKNDYNYRGNGDDDTIHSKQLKSDYFKIDKNGNVLNSIAYNYKGSVRLDVYEISDIELKIENANFITNAALCVQGSKLGCTNTNRHFRIQRSNTIINNITHNIIDDNIPTGYNGFIFVLNASDVSIKNSKFGAHAIKHKKYSGAIGGTYDLALTNSSNITFDNVSYSCEESESLKECYYNNMINTNYFGITGCNNLKNWEIKNSIINRIDSHQPSQNISVSNSILGWAAVNVNGGGQLNVLNTSIDQAENIVFLRADYGGSWNGNIKINNVYFNTKDYNGSYTTAPRIVKYFSTNTFNAENGGFGYPLYVPSINVSNVFFDEKNYVESMSEYHKKTYESSPGIILVQNTAKLKSNKFNELENSSTAYNYKPTLVGDMKFNNLRSMTFDKLKISETYIGNNLDLEYTYLSGTEKKTIKPWGAERWDIRKYTNSYPINLEIDIASLTNKSFTTYYKNTYFETINGIETKRSGNNAVDIITHNNSKPYCIIETDKVVQDDWYDNVDLELYLKFPTGFNIIDYGLGYSPYSYSKTKSLNLTKSHKGIFNVYGYIIDDRGTRYDCIKLIKKS